MADEKPTLNWILVACTVALSAVLLGLVGEPFQPGTERIVRLTVVPLDRTGLRCATSEVFGDYGCSKKGARRLAPYVTTKRELILLSDVFAHEAVAEEAKRRSKLPPGQRRMTVECEIIHLAYSTGHRVRFGRRGRWDEAKGWIAQSRSCRPTTR